MTRIRKETVMTATIKDRLLEQIRNYADKRGVVNRDFNEVARANGLNGHDLAKNLDQLHKQGYIEVAWKDGRVERLSLSKRHLAPPRARSHAHNVIQWLIDHAAQADDAGWIPVSTSQIGRDLGIEMRLLSPVLTIMYQRGQIEAQRANANSVTALRLPQAPVTEPVKLAVVPTVELVTNAEPVSSIPLTPLLYEYLTARRIAGLAPESNPYLTVTFTSDPRMEEARLLLLALQEKQ